VHQKCSLVAVNKVVKVVALKAKQTTAQMEGSLLTPFKKDV